MRTQSQHSARWTRRAFLGQAGAAGLATVAGSLVSERLLNAAQSATAASLATVPSQPSAIAQVRLRGRTGLWNVQLAGGRITQISQAPVSGPAVVAGGGKLLTEGFVEHHIHLDKGLTVDRYKWDDAGLKNDRERFQKDFAAGKLIRGFTVWRENQIRETYTEDDVFGRALRVVKMASAYGTTSMRTHCVVDAVRDLHSLKGLLRVREAVRPYMDLQISLHPQDGMLLRGIGEPELIVRGLELGADGIGGIPDVEKEKADEYIDLIFKLAKEHGKFVDIHDQARDVPFPPPIMVAKTKKYGLQGKVTVSHGFSLANRPPAALNALFDEMKQENVAIAAAPTGTLQERIQIPRSRGVRVSLITDNVGDPWNRGAKTDPVDNATEYINRMNIDLDEGLEGVFDMITTLPAQSLGLTNHGMREGATADLVLWDAESVPQAMADAASRSLVLKNGKVVAQAGKPLW